MADDLFMIMAVVQPFRLDAITLALEELPGFGGMTVTPCRGFGQEKSSDAESDALAPNEAPQLRRSSDAAFVDFTAKIRIEVVVATRELSDAVVDVILRSAQTGRRGDGKIFVWAVSRAVRIRTSEEGESAL
jgi:nitrogen regulatory protein P-II 1